MIMSSKCKNYLAGVFVSTPKTRGEGLKPRRKTFKERLEYRMMVWRIHRKMRKEEAERMKKARRKQEDDFLMWLDHMIELDMMFEDD